MAINIQHTYTTPVDIYFYSKEDHTLYCYAFNRHDYGDMDSIAECICRELIKHNFSYADVCSTETGEVLMKIERS